MHIYLTHGANLTEILSNPINSPIYEKEIKEKYIHPLYLKFKFLNQLMFLQHWLNRINSHMKNLSVKSVLKDFSFLWIILFKKKEKKKFLYNGDSNSCAFACTHVPNLPS